MKNFTTLKTLLVGLCAMGATSAWAQATTTYDFENGEKLFSEDSRVSVSVVDSKQTIYGKEFELDGKALSFKGASNAQNGYCFAHFDFSSLCDQAAKVTVEFDAVLGNGARSRISLGDAVVRGKTGNSSKVTYNNKGAIFMIGTEKTEGYINGTHNADLLTGLTQKWLKVTVEIDEIAKTYTYSIVDKTDSKVLYNNGDNPISFWSTDASNCTQIDFFGYINNSQMGLIDNLSITVTKDERKYAGYTVKFVDANGTEIKEADSSREGAVGDGISLLPADKEAFKNEDGSKKYFYESDDAETITIAEDGSTVVSITYREANVWNWVVNFVAGDVTLGSKTGSGFEGDQINVPYPMYLEADGQLYKKDKGLSASNEFNFKFNLTENDLAKSIEYAAVTDFSNIVYLSEGEDIEGLTPCNSANTGVRSSNSSSAYAPSDTKITTLEAGKYKLYAVIYDASKSPNSHWIFMAGDNQIADLNCTAVNIQELASEEFEIFAETDIIMAKAGNNNMGLDAIYIQKTGDVELPDNVVANVTDAGYATFSSEYALDLSSVSGIEAYTATLDGSNVTFTKQTGTVAPGTGLLIKATEGQYEIPVATSGEKIANNALIGMLSASDVVAGSYVLMTKPYVGFFKTTSSFTCTANTAYIAPLPAEARIVLPGNDATAIKAIEAEKNGEVYNLAGQRVVKAQKGLYIMNGKKVVVK